MKAYFYLLIVLMVLLGGCSQNQEQAENNDTQPVLKVEPVNLSAVKIDKTELSSFYKLESLEVELKVPEYKLPLKENQIKNYANFNNKISLDNAKDSLLKNGFVIIKNPFNSHEEDIISPYNSLKDEEIPVFITTDSLLHLYHIQFDETLRQIEERQFYEMIWNISIDLQQDSVKKYAMSEGDVKEAARRNVAYFSVGLSLLKPNESQLCPDERQCRYLENAYFNSDELIKYNFSVPDFVKDDVDEELELIEKHEGFLPSPTFIYNEDYSQYVPRGHYTRSEKLKNYFKAMMWYGSTSMLLKGTEEIEYGKTAPFNPKGLISTRNAKIQTISASLITSSFSSSESLKTDWNRIYAVTAFYVGLSDDLGPYEYTEALNKVLTANFTSSDLNDENLLKLKAELAKSKSPKIYGGTGECGREISSGEEFKPEHLDECLDKSKGFRLMGQRFIPDSYMFSKLVFPTADKFKGKEPPFTACYIEYYGYVRCFPRGLDVMALLGSEHAREILRTSDDDNYAGYEGEFHNLSQEFGAFSDEDWNKNLYWSWLYSLKSLLKNYGKGHPTFMQTGAWHKKELHTALSSWTELRHDTILYAKQSYTMTGRVTSIDMRLPEPEKPVVGYIEPVPEFYNRLLALTNMTRQGLEEKEVLDETAKSRLDNLILILQRLRDLSAKELENQELSQEDYDFIKNFGDNLNGVISEVDEKAKKTTIVADVHTDQNTKSVLEEGVGYVDLIVVAYKLPDGRILIGAGPVMSYYEFKQPMKDRLTDEKWRSILTENKEPEKPEWASNFITT